MTRIVSSVLVYSSDVTFENEIEPVLERHMRERRLAGWHHEIGLATVYSFDIRVDDAFILHDVEDKLNDILPNAHITMIDCPRGSWWARHMESITVSAGCGLAVGAIYEFILPAIGRP